MKSSIKKSALIILPLIDFLLTPFVCWSAWILKKIRRFGVEKLPHCKKALLEVGVFPILDHYYEPQFNYKSIKQLFSQDRFLPGIEWNISEQLQILDSFIFSQELKDIPSYKAPGRLEFHFNNGSFESGDAEYWYQLIRAFKPKKIFEIGSGYSTLIAIKAIHKNIEEEPDYKCRHLCIEPYEIPWLEETGVSVMRKMVEDVDLTLFSELQENDILFIDSSHIIRPRGDVLFEYLEILPTLNKGVVVHVHDIFSQKNYLQDWLENQVKFWNEQYLLEAFLCHNSAWKIIGSLNYLHHKYHDRLKSIAPFLLADREPGSFYIQKVI